MLGTVKTFNARTGHGTIQCNALNTVIALCVTDIADAERNLQIGDLLQFQCEPSQGRPKITSFVLVARAGLASSTPPISSTLHANPAPRRSSTPIADAANYSAHVACHECGKYMVPRLTFRDGYPQRSFCPFCAEMYEDFTGTEDAPNIVQKSAAMAVDGVLSLLMYLVIAGLCAAFFL